MNLLDVLLYILLGLALLAAALVWFTYRTARRVEAYLPRAGSMVDVPGGRIHVREQGTGPAVVLIHGLAGQMANFDYGVAESLALHHRVVLLDRPGAGYSERAPGTPADLSTQAAAVAQVFDRLGLHRPTVAGHSLGGALALTLALEHPDKVGALALVAPLTHPLDAPPPPFKVLAIEPPWLRKAIAWTLATPVGILQGDSLLREVFAPEPVPADFQVRGGGLLGLRPRHFLGACADQQAVGPHMRALERRYDELRLPIGILYGRQDALLDWKLHGERLARRLPHARLELVDGGHMLPVTMPGRTASFIEAVADGA